MDCCNSKLRVKRVEFLFIAVICIVNTQVTIETGSKSFAVAVSNVFMYITYVHKIH